MRECDEREREREREKEREDRFYKKKKELKNNYAVVSRGPGASLSPVWLWPYPIFPRLKANLY